MSNQAEATLSSTISRSRQRVTFAVRRATPLCGLSITLIVARHLYSEGENFSHCKVNISPRQRFVCIEAVLGEVCEWIVGHSENDRDGDWHTRTPFLAINPLQTTKGREVLVLYRKR